MGLITEEVEVGSNCKNIKYYENKGYKFERYYDEYNKKMSVKKGTKIIVKIEDLSDNSRVFVDAQCDGCGKILEKIRWSDYTKQVKQDKTYYCHKCAHAGFKQYTSFYDWCYENLHKEESDKLMLRWDYDLNIDKNGKVLSPKDVSYTSKLNKKGYWFKCLDHSKHESELKNTTGFISGQKGSIECNQCNSIASTHANLIDFFVDKEDAYKYSFGSWNKVLARCPDCGYEKRIAITNLVNHGFGCNRCGDGISFPEKVMLNILEQLNKKFIMQLSKIIFKWCGNFRYDFYIEEINGICEVQGIQHYEETNGKWASLKETQENDIKKENLAKNNNIINYIVLDCRKSELEWIKNSIMQSELPTLLGFKEEDIDWFKCLEFAYKSLVKKACELWNNKTNIIDISRILKLNENTIRNYLKKGTEIGWCNYNPKKQVCKKIICLTTGEIFNSITDACSNGRQSIRSNISACCKGKSKSAGKHSITGKPLRWMFYDEYLKTQD